MTVRIGFILDKRIQKAIKLGLCVEIVILFLASMILDGGGIVRCWAIAFVGYAAMAGMIILRRRMGPTPADIVALQCGPLVLTSVAIAFLALYIRTTQ